MAEVAGVLEVEVTDHAIVRYLERVMQLDISSIREKILTEEFMKQYKFLAGSGGEYTSGENFSLVVYKHRIVTIKT